MEDQKVAQWEYAETWDGVGVGGCRIRCGIIGWREQGNRKTTLVENTKDYESGIKFLPSVTFSGTFEKNAGK